MSANKQKQRGFCLQHSAGSSYVASRELILGDEDDNDNNVNKDGDDGDQQVTNHSFLQWSTHFFMAPPFPQNLPRKSLLSFTVRITYLPPHNIQRNDQ